MHAKPMLPAAAPAFASGAVLAEATTANAHKPDRGALETDHANRKEKRAELQADRKPKNAEAIEGDGAAIGADNVRIRKDASMLRQDREPAREAKRAKAGKKS